MKTKIFYFVLTLFLCNPLWGNIGVLIPANVKNEPDPSIVSLKKMTIEVDILDQFANISIVQIFQNHTAREIEGKYILTLPKGASIHDFAIWEDHSRIPGIIIEKNIGERIYENLTYEKVDPGLIQSEDDPSISRDFVVKVYPIPAHGTKRVEVKFCLLLPISSMKTQLSLPLKPISVESQKAKDLTIHIHLVSAVHIKNVKLTCQTYPFQIKEKKEKDTYTWEAHFQGQDVDLKEDINLEYEVALPGVTTQFFSHRDISQKGRLDLSPFGGRIYKDLHGYFHSRTLFNIAAPAADQKDPHAVVILFDTSTSMQWDKLKKGYEGLVFFLNQLKKEWLFEVVLFNKDIFPLKDSLQTATREHINQALQFLQNSYLAGGTDFFKAVEKGLELSKTAKGGFKKDLIIITDGFPTFGQVQNQKLIKSLTDPAQRGKVPRLFIFGMGNQQNSRLLQKLCDATEGYFMSARETEDIGFKLQVFFNKLGEDLIKGVKMTYDPKILKDVYPVGDHSAFNGAEVNIFGRYLKPDTVELSYQYLHQQKVQNFKKSVTLPEQSTSHRYIRRLWAKLRVDFLLDLINEKGEREEWIREIIELSKEFKFITPYTSFLAAPRALLRPRVIKPGDPILRVRTVKQIVRVIAVFPFGEVKSLIYNPADDIWETRFLAPIWMNDGEYSCELILYDKFMNQYREQKQFIIDSHPPLIRVIKPGRVIHKGDSIDIAVSASIDTRRIVARLENMASAPVKYHPEKKLSVGRIILPEDILPGKYTLSIIAEDFAKNISVKTLEIEIKGL